MSAERRSLLAGAAVFVLLAAATPLLDDFQLSLAALIFLFAYFGQAWNLMMGFAGLLSLGHALFVGIGAYALGILVVRFGLSPWVAAPAGMLLAGGVGAAIAWLGFRFSVRGVHFALLTIAFAELARVVFDNWALTGGSGGLFLPARNPQASPLGTWRGGATFFYLFTLGLCAAATLLAALLARRRTGYVWRALKADQDAARALGVRALRNKVAAVALSAALTALGGSVYALMNGSIFPDSSMGMRMSIDIIIGPIIGGLGTAFGPLVGAAFVLPLADAAAHLGGALGVAGLNILVYGIVLILVIRFLPHGIVPAIAALVARWPR